MIKILSVLVVATILLLFLNISSEATQKCVSIKQDFGYEKLVNSCDVCLDIKVLRNRAGYVNATYRDFRIFESGEIILPFKGAGRSRIIGQEPCNSLMSLSQELRTDTSRKISKCIIPVSTSKGMLLANTCNRCINFILERTFSDGERVHKSYGIMAGQSLPLNREGANHVELIHEKTC